MTQSQNTIVVAGATGQQGGAVARQLLAEGWSVRGLTRDPASDRAKALSADGAQVVQRNLDDSPSLEAALRGVHGVFGVHNFTAPQIAAVLSRVLGRPVQVDDQLPNGDPDSQRERDKMMRWFNERGYVADIGAERRIHPGLLTLEAWARNWLEAGRRGAGW